MSPLRLLPKARTLVADLRADPLRVLPRETSSRGPSGETLPESRLIELPRHRFPAPHGAALLWLPLLFEPGVPVHVFGSVYEPLPSGRVGTRSKSRRSNRGRNRAWTRVPREPGFAATSARRRMLPAQ